MRPAFVAALVFAALLWLLHGVLAPFIAGFILAYIAHPLVSRLAKRIGRPTAAFIVIIGSCAALVVGLLIATPLLIEQAVSLLNALPAAAERLQTNLLATYGQDAQALLHRIPEGFDVGALTGSLVQTIGRSVPALNTVLAQAGGLVDWLSFALITPVVAFYLAADFPRLLQVCDESIPRRYVAVVRHGFSEIDRVLSAFVRGQTAVCVLQAMFYAPALGFAGIPYGLFIGVSAGLLSFIPYIGTMTGYLAAVIAALAAYGWDWSSQVKVAAVFAVGQLLEGYLWVPKLVGESVGLHPVWIIFGLLAMNHLLGFTGLLLAVPLTAACAVPLRLVRARYLSGDYYRAT